MGHWHYTWSPTLSIASVPFLVYKIFLFSLLKLPVRAIMTLNRRESRSSCLQEKKSPNLSTAYNLLSITTKGQTVIQSLSHPSVPWVPTRKEPHWRYHVMTFFREQGLREETFWYFFVIFVLWQYMLNDWTAIFSCPGQLNRWHCQSVSEWVSKSLLISASSEQSRAEQSRAEQSSTKIALQ